METLLSMLGLYQLSALMLPGAVGVSGAYYVIAGLPPNPTTAAILGVVVLFYIAGNVVQGVAVIWESRYWQRSGGWPSSRRMSPDDAKAYDPALRALIEARLDDLVGTDTSALPVGERFALARAELRRRGLDVRSESFNSIYGLSRGLLTAGVVVVSVAIACVVIGHEVHRNWIAALVVGACIVPMFVRFRRFSFYFADQTWKDFAALPASE